MNALVPQAADLHIVAQRRNELQSMYELDFETMSTPGPPAEGLRARLGSLQWGSLFRLGMRHIAEGTDHLLFLLVLLLPAPLLATRGRWRKAAGVRLSLRHILGIVTAFTIGHSITLALAALNVVHLPERPIEVLIAVSILISAVHAIRPLFPGREAWVAAFFGLIHGLAFATTLARLGLTHWQRVAGILSFNLGIETMQLLVVAAVLPSLLLLSRTPAYPVVRLGGAIFAGLASLGWIAERLLPLQTPVDTIVNTLAHHAVAAAVALFLFSVACERRQAERNRSEHPRNTNTLAQTPTAPSKLSAGRVSADPTKAATDKSWKQQSNEPGRAALSRAPQAATRQGCTNLVDRGSSTPDLSVLF